MSVARDRTPLQPYRLPHHGVVDRARPLKFEFDGHRYRGFAGDTLASALLAAGVRLVGRSFKYHRPRGIVAAGSEEPNALVELRCGRPARAQHPCDGRRALRRARGAQPELTGRMLRFDLGAVNSLLSPIFVAGFYYKTFMWPAAFWEKLYEPLIRRAAGLGRASHEPDPDTYDKAHAFCDVLIIGGGPAGLAAALLAGRSGARVILCDEDFILGGRLNGDRHVIDDLSGRDWAWRIESELRSMPNVRIMPRTTVFGAYDGGLSGARTYGALERVCDHLAVPAAHRPRQRLWKIIARQSVLAAGGVERPVVFGGNDRPGVMLASAVRTYVNRFGVAPGRRAAIFTVERRRLEDRRGSRAGGRRRGGGDRLAIRGGPGAHPGCGARPRAGAVELAGHRDRGLAAALAHLGARSGRADRAVCGRSPGRIRRAGTRASR